MRSVVVGPRQPTGILSMAKIPRLIAGTARTPIPNRHRTPHRSPDRGTTTGDQAMRAIDGNVGTAAIAQNAMDPKIPGPANANSTKLSPRPFLHVRPSRSSTLGTCFFSLDTSTNTSFFTTTGRTTTPSRISIPFITAHAPSFGSSVQL